MGPLHATEVTYYMVLEIKGRGSFFFVLFRFSLETVNKKKENWEEYRHHQPFRKEKGKTT